MSNILTKQQIEAELQGFFKGKQVRFSEHANSMVSVYDMVYDGKNWFTIVGRALIDFSKPVTSLAKAKHDLTVSLNEAFEQHVINAMQEK